MIDESIICPYPDHLGYVQVWSTLSYEEKKHMVEKFRFATNSLGVPGLQFSFALNGVEKKRIIAPLCPDHDGENVIHGSTTNGGKDGIVYITPSYASQYAKDCWLYHFSYSLSLDECKELVSLFPWRMWEDKIKSFTLLIFWSEWENTTIPLLTGYWHPHFQQFRRVGEYGYVTVSDTYVWWKSTSFNTLKWSHKDDYYNADIERCYSFNYPQPAIAFEDCE